MRCDVASVTAAGVLVSFISADDVVSGCREETLEYVIMAMGKQSAACIVDLLPSVPHTTGPSGLF
jgi:sorbitol-specific phosphotransferase system component IIBC